MDGLTQYSHHFSMPWSPSVLDFYHNKDFSAITKFYENQLEECSDDLDAFWHLALAHTLNGASSEVESLLFYFESRGQATDDLIPVFVQEKQHQLDQGNLNLALLVAEQLVKLSPENPSTLLDLLEVEIKLGRRSPSKLLDLLPTMTEIDSERLWKVVKDLLWSVDLANLELLNSIWVHCPATEKRLDDVRGVVGALGADVKNILYTSGLIKSCLAQSPEDVSLLKTLLDLYLGSGQLLEARKVTKQLYSATSSSTLKLCAHYYLLYTYFLIGDWSGISPLISPHLNLLKEVAKEKDVEAHPLAVEALLFAAQPLLYFQDSPEENQYLRQAMGTLFTSALNVPPKCFLLPTDERKLKIGYIGHTFRRHSVAWLCRWLIKYHDRVNFDTFLYLVNQKPDDLTQEWFLTDQNTCRIFSNPHEHSPGSIATQIESDGIDILIDLDSITCSYTLSVLAHRPAPIQATWLGYDASGLDCIDYFICDQYCVEPSAQSYYAEKLWRLPSTYLAVDGFEVGVPTLSRENLGIPDDAIIYLNTQRGMKRNPDSVILQLKIVKWVEGSYLLFKGSAREKEAQAMILELAKEIGVAEHRLRFLDNDIDEPTHRANLGIADVVLDTFPYNGATTTLEVLWMGIPIVTKVGRQFASRNTYGFMVNAGIEEGIAWSDEEYVEWGVRLGTEPGLRSDISYRLRGSKQSSPLWNSKAFTKEMEKAYQQMWQAYLKRRDGD